MSNFNSFIPLPPWGMQVLISSVVQFGSSMQRMGNVRPLAGIPFYTFNTMIIIGSNIASYYITNSVNDKIREKDNSLISDGLDLLIGVTAGTSITLFLYTAMKQVGGVNVWTNTYDFGKLVGNLLISNLAGNILYHFYADQQNKNIVVINKKDKKLNARYDKMRNNGKKKSLRIR